MIRPRQINIEDDKKLILEFHCQTNYASDTPWARRTSYDQYRDKWFSTSQPDEFYSYFVETTQDPRTMAEFKDYGLSVAEIYDLLVTPEFQGRGIGLQMLQYIEEKAIVSGANLIRSETGIENTPSIKLHEKSGFYTYRVLFEKRLGS